MRKSSQIHGCDVGQACHLKSWVERVLKLGEHLLLEWNRTGRQPMYPNLTDDGMASQGVFELCLQRDALCLWLYLVFGDPEQVHPGMVEVQNLQDHDNQPIGGEHPPKDPVPYHFRHKEHV
jgi:hypothetical protein